jgi:hypothetical protein
MKSYLRAHLRVLGWLTAIFLTSCASIFSGNSGDLRYSPDLFTPITFLENKSHLAMNIPYIPVESLRKEVEKRLGSDLKNRGEAHITVITPPEYERLKSRLPKRRAFILSY